jgi:predicted outer membrane repeat protein
MLAFDLAFNGTIGPGAFRTPGEFAMGDISGDGINDLVFSESQGDDTAHIGLRIGDGRGNFSSLSDLVSVGQVADIKLADINRDGKLDLVYSGANDGFLRTRLGSGNATFGNEVTGPQLAPTISPSSLFTNLELADIDGDGYLDAVGGSANSGIRIGYDDGTGHFHRNVAIYDGLGGVQSMSVLDVTSDGAPDIVYTTLGGADLNVMSGLRSTPHVNSASFFGGLAPNTYLAVANTPSGVLWVLAEDPASGNGRVVFGHNPNAPTDIGQIGTNWLDLGSPALGDFDSNGVIDLGFVARLNSGDSSGTLHLVGGNPGNQPFTGLGSTYLNGFTCNGVHAADMNADGNTDILVSQLGRNGPFDDWNVWLNRQQSLVVSSTADENDGNARWNSGTGTSLREAFAYAKSLGGTRSISFAPFLQNANATLSVTNGPMLLSDNSNAVVTLANDRGRITLDGNNTSMLFSIPGTSTLNLRNLTISNFKANALFGGHGAAAYVDFDAHLNVDRVTFTGNTGSGSGSAIYSYLFSGVTIRNSTFVNNGGDSAVALDASNGGSATLENNTFSNNNIGLRVLGGTVVLRNNIIANNGSADIAISAGALAGNNNIVRTGTTSGLTGTINADPQLAALAYNGGLTPTMNLGSTSPAINAATSFVSLTTDQRGVARPVFGAFDIGALELRGSDLAGAYITAGDGAIWYLEPDAASSRKVYREAGGAPVWVDGGMGSELAVLNGEIVVRTSSGNAYLRTGSSSGPGTAWTALTAIAGADGASWFLAAGPGGASSIYRWATGATPTYSNGSGSRLGLLPDGQVVTEAGGTVYVRSGSNAGLGSNWIQLTTISAGDSAKWFLVPGAPSGLLYAYRWANGESPTYSNGYGSRFGLTDNGTVLVQSGNTVYARIGSNAGIGSSWDAEVSTNAGDGAIWFLFRDSANLDPQIYRWAANENPGNTTGRGTSLFTVNGVIFTRNSGGSLYLRLGSASGIGSSWQSLPESLVVTTAADEGDFTSAAAIGNGTSLREALAFAQQNPGPDSITFAPALQGQTITLNNGATGTSDDTALRNGTDVTIDGGSGVTIDLASPTPRRILLTGGGTLNLKNLTLSGGDIRNNNYGGALWNNATANLTNVHFTNNKANKGGAVLNVGTMTINNSLFDNNSTAAGGEGGAIWNSSALDITGSTFYQNAASVLGGAIVSFGGLTIADSNFSTNHSDFNGGALRLAGTAVISGSTFANNSAVNGGGALISHGNTTITNSTIAYNNSLDGGGAQFFEGTADLRNLTVAYNGVTRSGGGFVVNFADVTTMSTIISGNFAPDQNNLWGSPLNTASGHNLIDADMAQLRLGAFANNGGPTVTLPLLPGSIAINAGVGIASVTTDQRGVARPQGSAPDIGAYERFANAVQPTGVMFESDALLAVTFSFNGDASVSVSRTDIQLQNLDTLQSVSAGTLSFNNDGTQATLLLSNLLPDGNYRAMLGTTSVDFFVLAGDFDRDRTVDFADLVPLAQNYNATGMTNLRGEANYDGVVNFADLVMLSQNYGRSLPGMIALTTTIAKTTTRRSRESSLIG